MEKERRERGRIIQVFPQMLTPWEERKQFLVIRIVLVKTVFHLNIFHIWMPLVFESWISKGLEPITGYFLSLLQFFYLISSHSQNLEMEYIAFHLTHAAEFHIWLIHLVSETVAFLEDSNFTVIFPCINF